MSALEDKGPSFSATFYYWRKLGFPSVTQQAQIPLPSPEQSL